jgi:hypothetical protein
MHLNNLFRSFIYIILFGAAMVNYNASATGGNMSNVFVQCSDNVSQVTM